MLSPAVAEAIRGATGAGVKRAQPLGGGCIGAVFRVDLADGRRVVAKVAEADTGLATEGFMLRYLGAISRLPVPEVVFADDRLLVMKFVAHDGRLDEKAEDHAAELIAELHAIGADAFGFERDTLIGGLAQPNPWTRNWIAFFRDRRLLHMGRLALDEGRISAALYGRLEALADRLERWLDAPATPSLVHGDLWSGNVLCRAGRIAAFVDPAIYYADAEIELAFATLFGTFGRRFFERYGERRPLRPGFFEVRRDLYNLYPLLVHARLFGGAYVGAVERTLGRFAP